MPDFPFSFSLPARTATSTVTTVTTAVVAATALWLAHARKKHLRRRRLARFKEQEHCQTINLLPCETSIIITTSPPTSTITFFETSSPEDVETAKAYFETRTRAIVEANPWLTGFLDADETTGDLALFVPQRGNTDSNADNNNSSTNNKDGNSFVVLDTLRPIPEDYHAMVGALEPALIGMTVEHVAFVDAARWEPLWKVAFVPNAGPVPKSKDKSEVVHRFGLVVSANHSLIDGHGYYRLFNMLSCQEPITSLSPIRKHDLGPSIKAVTGHEPSFLEECPWGFVVGFVVSMIRNAIVPRTKSIGMVISKDWIREQKESYRATLETEPEATTEPQPPFVSTNDLIVSKFCRESNCDLALMAMNLRGRASGCTEDLVGNYEHLLAYCKDDCTAPANIRKSVSGPVCQRVGAGDGTLDKGNNRLPTNAEHLFGCKYAVITNWATFARELKVGSNGNGRSDPDTNFQQTLHLPILDFPKSTPACNMGSMVIFRPREGEVGILAGGDTGLMEKLAASRMVGSLLHRS